MFQSILNFCADNIIIFYGKLNLSGHDYRNLMFIIAILFFMPGVVANKVHQIKPKISRGSIPPALPAWNVLCCTPHIPAAITAPHLLGLTTQSDLPTAPLWDIRSPHCRVCLQYGNILCRWVWFE